MSTFPYKIGEKMESTSPVLVLPSERPPQSKFKVLAQLSGICFALIVGLWGLEQGLRYKGQYTVEKEEQETIQIMKDEQDKLIKEQLTTPVKMGVFDLDPLTPWNYGEDNLGAFTVKNYPQIKGVSLSAMSILALKLINKDHFSPVISVPKRDKNKKGQSFFNDLRDITRHELGHVYLFNHDQSWTAVQGWSQELNTVMIAHLNDKNDGNKVNFKASFWRSEWLQGVRNEAFADAYSILTSARNGDEEFKKNALNQHANRIFPGASIDGVRVVTSTIEAGGDHAVELTGWIIGQMDSKIIAQLNQDELTDLAGKVSNDVTAATLARVSSTLNWFNPQGLVWWNEIYKKQNPQDYSVEKAKAYWEAWRNDSLSKEPKILTQGWSYNVNGTIMNIKGLPLKKMSMWRYDGWSEDKPPIIRSLLVKKMAFNQERFQENYPIVKKNGEISEFKKLRLGALRSTIIQHEELCRLLKIDPNTYWDLMINNATQFNPDLIGEMIYYQIDQNETAYQKKIQKKFKG